MATSVLQRPSRPTDQQPAQAGRDLIAWAVGLAAAVISVIAYAVTVRVHGSLLYVDSIWIYLNRLPDTKLTTGGLPSPDPIASTA